jgi:hypothetical protein
MTVKTLKQLVSQYRQHHNIRGYSKMKKAELLTELDKRFVIHKSRILLRHSSALGAARERCNEADQSYEDHYIGSDNPSRSRGHFI